ncbi:cytochrome P450 4F6-like isoform X1 [Pecten maximus]|uniref:cytochrome P450 4F6-like isoform X1 n=2 Tax=Pecten maximus TaxID=6579 RepID=UPI0014588025|nr:cytochrome P450 4F6-like isoform X1 [Pecten maximus]XP_033748763.1 cytochrome P450 4F6-like isoform X1 [Pecten maximus]XP_033748764.1 cytochrome P450 4F6-like isoform X1 [Pecten maximus]
MDMLFLIISSLLSCVLLWKVIAIIKTYIIYIGIYNSEKFLSIGKFHPIWGHLHLIPEFSDYVCLVRKGIQETGKRISGVWLMFFFPILTACHPETAKVLLRSSEPKPKRFGEAYYTITPWLGDGLVLSNGHKWERNRRLLTPAFHFDVLKSYVDLYNEVFDIFLDNMAKATSSGKSVEVQEPFILAALDTMLRSAFSHDSRVQEQSSEHPYVEGVRRLTYLTTYRTLRPWLYPDFLFKWSAAGKEYFSHTKYIHEFDEKVIRDRRASLKSDPSSSEKHRLDFLDILLTARDENGTGLTDREVRDEVDTFLFAGHDTTSAALGWATYLLSQNPEEQEKVYEEVALVVGDKHEVEWSDIQALQRLPLFIKESLRMYTPVPLISRVTTHETEIDGLIIPANNQITILIDAMNHREDVWKDPETFRPDRFLDDSSRDPYSFVPFSAGPRNCIGQNFAMNEIKVALAKLVKRFRLLPDNDHTPVLSYEGILRSKVRTLG